jgi:hypothetical protein
MGEMRKASVADTGSVSASSGGDALTELGTDEDRRFSQSEHPVVDGFVVIPS